MKFNKITPNFSVNDVKETIHFYESILGFSLVMAVPESQDVIEQKLNAEKEYVYALVIKESVEFMFQRSDSFNTDVEFAKELPLSASVSFYIEMNDLEQYYEMVKPKVKEITPIKKAWYGMNEFSNVFEFHKPRFAESDTVPMLFAGDFNAVPHTDGGRSPASKALLEVGFTDAYRSLYPDVAAFKGPTHRSGSRIDQIYHKGSGLKNTSTKVISKARPGFPSDHFLIISKYDLNYSTSTEKKNQNSSK